MEEDEEQPEGQAEIGPEEPENPVADERAREVKASLEKKERKRMESLILEREYSNKRNSYFKTLNADFQNDFFCQKDIREHTGCINAVQFSSTEKLLATGGDDLHARIWNVDELMLRKHPRPISISEKGHESNIFSLEFDLDSRFIYSGERWGLLFKHDITTKQHIYTARGNEHHGDVYSIHHHPFDIHQLVVAQAKSISFLDDRDYENPIQFVNGDEQGDFYTAEFHPETPVLVLINSEDGGPKVFDRRNPARALYESNKFTGFFRDNGIADVGFMGAKWSPSGKQYMALRRKQCPIYFDIVSQRCLTLASGSSPLVYRNAKTIKSMTFIDDYTVATGSDLWGIHVWKAPRADDDEGFVLKEREGGGQYLTVEKEVKVLRGHRSIPNQIRFSSQNQLLVSSGVENSFKLWSHRRLPWSYDVPFARRKRGEYRHTHDVELGREREMRRTLEDDLEERNLMEGRACWEDVFGGNPQTMESRETLEMFDVFVDDDDDDDVDDESSDGEDFAARVFQELGFPRGRLEFLVHQGEDVLVRALNAQNAMNDSDSDREYDDDEIEEERRRMRIEAARRRVIPPLRRDWFDHDSDSDLDENDPLHRLFDHIMEHHRHESSDEEDDEEIEGDEPVVEYQAGRENDEVMEEEEQEEDEQSEEEYSDSDDVAANNDVDDVDMDDEENSEDD
ncbi:hypothetical protein L5515_007506 [Caenorhabditis briggsae]|uniref:Uncharacterized protein n=1 Tax=Caenorhabditis briggsae TaxID=6238 RepID=A0AAE9F5A7_CAEBR|nr:hypothetical protein L5515_007506 [Caenorhabditis briggsae]